MKERAVLAFTVLVALTVAAHFAFVGYLVIGGFLAWRRGPRPSPRRSPRSKSTGGRVGPLRLIYAVSLMFCGSRGGRLANMSRPTADTPLNWSDLGVMGLLPTGTVTLLLADVEGSTRLWETDQTT
jgi:hypothetical protein